MDGANQHRIESKSTCQQINILYIHGYVSKRGVSFWFQKGFSERKTGHLILRHPPHTHTLLYIHILKTKNINLHINRYIYIYINTCIYTYTHKCIYIYIYIYLFIYLCTRIYIYIHILHTYIKRTIE